MKTVGVGIACLALLLTASGVQAAFIVEPAPGGKANATNFASTDGVPSTSATVNGALGLTPGLSSAFGGNGAIDEWVYSYRLGTDADNTVYAAGAVLGDTRIDPPGNPAGVSAEAQLATGLVGGVSGTYKVFITWPSSGNVNTAGSIVTVTSDGAPIVLDPVDQNGTPTNGPTPSGDGGENQWLLIGTVQLTAGNTYSVTQRANVASFVSQRSAGVMWELIPEPASLSLLALGGLFLRRRRRVV